MEIELFVKKSGTFICINNTIDDFTYKNLEINKAYQGYLYGRFNSLTDVIIIEGVKYESVLFKDLSLHRDEIINNILKD